jgi:hypothetical protein
MYSQEQWGGGVRKMECQGQHGLDNKTLLNKREKSIWQIYKVANM